MGMTSERDAEGAATPDGPALLQLIGIEKRFGSQTILQDFNLDVFDGEFLSFLGPSGCGKTTMLRIIAGFERTSSGQVILGGEDITARPPNRRDVSTVFQDYSLFPHLTVAENVAFGLVERKMSKSDIANRVGEMLDMVRLGDLADRKPAQISGGQKQRVALARSLAVRPRILLLDEPLGALDLNLRKDMQIELRSFQQRLGITFIFVTHDQEEALTMSDRIVVMKGGQIQQLGSAREVYDRPANRFVAGFIGETTLLRCERKTGSIASGRTMVSLFGQDIEVALPETGIPESENCLLSIRPEKILISDSASGCPNALAATIKTIIFKGAVQELILQLTKDVTIRATVSSAGATSCEGDNVFVGFLPADALLMAAD